MPYFTYDTSTIVSRSLTDLPNNFLLSGVVLMELMASAKDGSQRKVYEALYREYRLDNTLIVPVAEDWLRASQVLFWLTQERRRSAGGGRLPRLKPGDSQRMALDALIAASARRWKATIVTENWDDFKAIQRYCKVRIIKGSDFFK
jgi:predicted nucleic acid-binding protein